MGMPETVVLKQFKSFDAIVELFINEVSNNNWLLSKLVFNLTLHCAQVMIFHSLKFME